MRLPRAERRKSSKQDGGRGPAAGSHRSVGRTKRQGGFLCLCAINRGVGGVNLWINQEKIARKQQNNAKNSIKTAENEKTLKNGQKMAINDLKWSISVDLIKPERRNSVAQGGEIRGVRRVPWGGFLLIREPDFCLGSCGAQTRGRDWGAAAGCRPCPFGRGGGGGAAGSVGFWPQRVRGRRRDHMPNGPNFPLHNMCIIVARISALLCAVKVDTMLNAAMEWP